MWEANSAPLSFPSCLIIPVSGARRAAQPLQLQSSLFAHCSSSWTTVLEEPEAIGSWYGLQALFWDGVDCARNGQRFLVPWKAECQLGAADTSSSPKQRELLAQQVTPRFCFGKRSEFKMSLCTLVQELYTLRDALCNHTFPMIFCGRSSYPMIGTHGVVL